MERQRERHRPLGGHSAAALTDQLKAGLDAPICLTWEWTYACNLQCVHCLSSSGRAIPTSSTTDGDEAVVDDLHDLQVFYVNVGGGEPMLRPDFFELVEYCVDRGVGVKFSTNGGRITAEKAAPAGRRWTTSTCRSASTASTTTPTTPCAATAATPRPSAAMDHLPRRRLRPVQDQRRHDPPQRRAARRLRGARRRVRRRAAPHPLPPVGPRRRQLARAAPDRRSSRCTLYHWLLERPHVLTGDSFFHLSALGEPLPGLNLCGAGRVVCLIDPVGDVYACPFVLHDEFKAGSVRDPGGFGAVWRESDAVHRAARAAVGRARARRAAATTPARAAAWRPSSSPACRSTGPIPSA